MKLFIFALIVVFAAAFPLDNRNDAVDENWQLVPDSSGSMHLVDIRNIDNEEITPRFVAFDDVVFRLFTRSNPTTPQFIQINNHGQLISSNFNVNHQTRFQIHGMCVRVVIRPSSRVCKLNVNLSITVGHDDRLVMTMNGKNSSKAEKNYHKLIFGGISDGEVTYERVIFEKESLVILQHLPSNTIISSGNVQTKIIPGKKPVIMLSQITLEDSPQNSLGTQAGQNSTQDTMPTRPGQPVQTRRWKNYNKSYVIDLLSFFHRRINHSDTLLLGEPISGLINGHNTFELYIRLNKISQLVVTPLTTYFTLNGNDCTGHIEMKINGTDIMQLRNTLDVDWMYKVAREGYVKKLSNGDKLICKINATAKNIKITAVVNLELADLIRSTL